jgi:hypothetical protein
MRLVLGWLVGTGAGTAVFVWLGYSVPGSAVAAASLAAVSLLILVKFTSYTDGSES